MGQFALPGISVTLDGKACRLYVGPTLSALFHPASRFRDLRGLERVYLLFQPDLPGGPQELLQKVLRDLCQARGLPADRVKFVPLPGITDPTNHETIIQGVEGWLRRDDPFNFGARNSAKNTTRITINLSAGTPAMHACWLLLRWNGALGKPQAVVEYVQGDGGVNAAAAAADPLRVVPIDVLSQWVQQPAKKAAAEPAVKGEPGVSLEELKGPPFDELRQKIDHAALLGLPILLQGERGTGKTFLARYYHQRRQFYRHQRGQAPGEAPRKEAKEPARKGAAERPAGGERYPQRYSYNNFVTVTLSEFADLETLRDTLFGWAKNAWNLAYEAYDGLLGEAHGGTLFLDEIHHLDRGLQAALLGPLNCRRYRPKMATYEIISHFDLVVATNDPQWRVKMADDFRDRVERIVLEVPSFRSFQRVNSEVVWRLWEYTIRRRCAECGIEYTEEDGGRQECAEQLRSVFRRHPLPGNWRDLQRLADNVLLHLTAARDGRPTPLRWDRDQLEHAIAATFADL
jgi:hypothetical protein